MPQPLQGQAHGSRGDLPQTLPTELPNIHPGVSSTENAKNKIPGRPDQVAGSKEGFTGAGQLTVRGPETSTALKPAITPVKERHVAESLVLGVQQPYSFVYPWHSGPEIKGFKAAGNHELADGLIRSG